MNSRPHGFAFVLHAHLPFVLNHGRWPHGADWLNEAAAETYVPLLMMMRRLTSDGVKFKLNMGITPVLAEQLASTAFRNEFLGYLEHKVKSAVDNEAEFARQGQARLEELAREWRGFYQAVRNEFVVTWGGNLLNGFRSFERDGSLEILTCAATHGYLPLLGRDTAVQAQIRTGVRTHQRHFGRSPRGIWLPECAYRPRYSWTPPVGGRWPAEVRKGVDEFLSETGVGYFMIDTHMLRGGQAAGIYLPRFAALKSLWARYERETARPVDAERSPHRPYWVCSRPDSQSPVAAFTRDPDTGTVVWSGEHGYPGDGWYLDFHKKHHPGGLRYWRVTRPRSDMAEKETYEPGRVSWRLEENATHFVQLAGALLGAKEGVRKVMTAPYDAELFGHWWFEGVRWLEMVLRKFAVTEGMETVRLGDYLAEEPPEEVVSLPEGSWGQGGFHWIWLNEQTKWTWEHVYEAEDRMEKLAGMLTAFEAAGDRRAPQFRQLLSLVARELLILESSDWQFLISTFSARDYAEKRVKVHAADFSALAGMAERMAEGWTLGPDERAKVDDIKERDFIFADTDPAWWAKSSAR